MVGAASQHDDALALTACLINDLAALDPDLGHVGLVLGVGSIGSGLHFLLGNAAEVFGQDFLCHLADKVLGAVDAHIVIDKLLALQLGAVACQNFRVIGHHRAVIVVVAQTSSSCRSGRGRR